MDEDIVSLFAQVGAMKLLLGRLYGLVYEQWSRSSASSGAAPAQPVWRVGRLF
jgi:hypothetical protein